MYEASGQGYYPWCCSSLQMYYKIIEICKMRESSPTLMLLTFKKLLDEQLEEVVISKSAYKLHILKELKSF